jgi:HEAT repeat protein
MLWTYTTHLAVGDAADAIVELFLDEGLDVLVFCGAEVLLGRLAGDNVFADLKNLLGAEEGSDVVSAVEAGGENHCNGGGVRLGDTSII